MKKEAIRKIKKMRTLLVIAFIFVGVFSAILTLLLEGSPYQNIVMGIFVACGFAVIAVIGTIYIRSMSKCCCPHCGEGRKYRADEYFNRLLKSYVEGKGFECPKCHMVVEIE